MTNNSILLSSVEKDFRETGRQRPVFKDVTFCFTPGTIYVLQGKSGAGKSTLLSLIGLLDAPSRGKILFLGHDCERMSRKEKEELRSASVSFLFQDNNLFLDWTGLDNLKMVSSDTPRLLALASRLGIENLLSKKVQDLSKGEGTRLAICRCLLEDKPVILLDEPTGNLDSKNAAIVFDILKEESRKRIIVVVLHDFVLSEGATGFTQLFLADCRLNASFSSLQKDETHLLSLKKSKPLAKKESARFSWSLFQRSIKKSIFFAVLLCCLSFVSFAALSFSSFNQVAVLRNLAQNAGLPSVSVHSKNVQAGFLRNWDVTLLNENDGQEIPLSLAYGEKEETVLYDTTLRPKGHDVFVPSFLMDAYQIKEGESLTLRAPNGDLAVTARGVAVDLAGAIQKLTKALGDENAALKIAYTRYPSLASQELIQDYEELDDVTLAKGSLKPVLSLMDSMDLHVSEGYFISSRERFSLAGDSGLSGEDAYLVFGESALTPKVRSFLEKSIVGRRFAFISADALNCLNLADRFDHYRIKGFEAIPDALAKHTVSLELSDERKASIHDQVTQVGLYSSSGVSSWLVSVDSDSFENVLSMPSDFYGAVPENNVAGLSNIQLVKPIGYVLLSSCAVFIVIGIGFYLVGANATFKKEKTLLSALGYPDRVSFWVFARLLGILIAAAILIAFPLSLLVSSVWLNPAILGVYQLSGSINLFPLSWWIVAFSFCEFLIIPVSENVICLKTKKSNLSEEIKVSKE